MVNPITKDIPESYATNEKALRRFVRNMIKNHDFIGIYLEKRYVCDLGCYKQIIKISKNEEIFIENLLIIKRRLENFYENSKWIGITTSDTPGAPVGCSIWVDIDEDIFGAYQFTVKDVSFSRQQVCLKLETIKPCEEKNSSKKTNFSTLFDTSQSIIEEDDKPILSWNNFKNTTRFIFLLTLTIVTGGCQALKYFLDYILKLIEVLTPIVIAFFNAITKMFGYLCFLIAFLWNGGNSSKNIYNDFGPVQRVCYQPAYPYENRYRALQYRPKSSVVITELKE